MPSPLIAGVDIGGTNTRVALAQLQAPSHILARRTSPTPKPGVEPLVALVTRAVSSCLSAASQGRLCAVGCAVPGMTDAQRGIVLDAANLPGWVEVPLANLLEVRLKVPVRVGNDVNAAAIAEATYGAGLGCHSLVYMTISTGVSAGIVIGGQLIEGAHHSAGEIGNIIPDPVHLDRHWKPNGCLERTAAGMGLAEQWATITGGRVDAELVFAAAGRGNSNAERLVRRAEDYLAQAAVAIGSIVDPDRLILGGSIGLNQERVTDRIQTVLRRVLPFPPLVVPAALEHDAPLIGALLMAADASS